MRDFKDLRVWQHAHQFALAIYRASEEFPKEEKFGLTSQLRRATVSIETNIAEGCGRRTDGELARFLRIAMGSATEVECLLLLARDLGYLQPKKHERLDSDLKNVRKMLHGLIASVESKEEKVMKKSANA